MLLKFLLCVVFATPSLIAAQTAPSSSPAPRVQYPEDLGPSEIDVSKYPPEYQETYRKVFIPVFRFLGGTARAVNSPIIELDPRLEEAERRGHPALFSDARVAQVTADGWKKRVDEIRRRPPCCGACPVLTLRSARELWRFLVYDSIARKTGAKADDWARLRRRLIDQYEKEYAWKKRGMENIAASTAGSSPEGDRPGRVSGHAGVPGTKEDAG